MQDTMNTLTCFSTVTCFEVHGSARMRLKTGQIMYKVRNNWLLSNKKYSQTEREEFNLKTLCPYHQEENVCIKYHLLSLINNINQLRKHIKKIVLESYRDEVGALSLSLLMLLLQFFFICYYYDFIKVTMMRNF